MLLAARGGDDIGFGVCEAEAEDTPDPGGASNYNGGFAFEAKTGRHCFSASGLPFGF
jgi:hypothetical protein